MATWYKVIKTINGHQYLYWQQTYRVGKNVKTRNRYIGPVSTRTSASHKVPSPASPERTPLHAGRFTIPIDKTSAPLSRRPLNDDDNTRQENKEYKQIRERQDKRGFFEKLFSLAAMEDDERLEVLKDYRRLYRNLSKTKK